MSAIRELVLQKPAPVQEMLRILATRHGLDATMPDFLSSIEDHFRAALKGWQEITAKFAIEFPGYSEVQLAEMLIERLRNEPQHGWSRILRGNAN